MIAKVSTGRSFGGTVRYLYEGHRADALDRPGHKQAELLDYNGIRPDQDDMVKDFDRHRWLNPDLSNAVGHISISYHPDDSAKATNAAMVTHARAFMTQMGIDPELTQWAAIRHNDQSHPHFHLIYNRVDYNGKTISDAHNYRRSHKATRTIAQDAGLTVASEKKKDLGKTNTARLPGHDQVRYKICQAITDVIGQVASMKELKQSLKKRGIETLVQKKGQGMSFRAEGYAFKASEVDRAYSGGKIHTLIETNRQQQQDALQEQVRQQAAAARQRKLDEEKRQAQERQRLADLARQRLAEEKRQQLEAKVKSMLEQVLQIPVSEELARQVVAGERVEIPPTGMDAWIADGHLRTELRSDWVMASFRQRFGLEITEHYAESLKLNGSITLSKPGQASERIKLVGKKWVVEPVLSAQVKAEPTLPAPRSVPAQSVDNGAGTPQQAQPAGVTPAARPRPAEPTPVNTKRLVGTNPPPAGPNHQPNQPANVNADPQTTFSQLADEMKKRDEKKSFDQLAELMKTRDEKKKQEPVNEPKKEPKKQDQSKGIRP